MKRVVKTPIHLIELPPEDYDAFMRKIISNEGSIAVFEYMKKYNEVPKHIEIFETPHQYDYFQREILQEPKTGMYKFKGELVSYDIFVNKICDGRIKDYEIEVY